MYSPGLFRLNYKKHNVDLISSDNSTYFSYGAFVRNGNLRIINVKNREFYLDAKRKLLANKYDKVNFTKYDSGLRKYHYDIENDKLNYIFRDINYILYRFDYLFDSSKIVNLAKYKSESKSNGSLKYLHMFHNDTSIVYINSNQKSRRSSISLEGDRYITTNSYPILFNQI